MVRKEGEMYLTWDAEGDFLLWADKPVNHDGLWMSDNPAPTVEPVPIEIALMLGGKEDSVLREVSCEDIL